MDSLKDFPLLQTSLSHLMIGLQPSKLRNLSLLSILTLPKAFDTVSHPKLLYRLKQYGIDGYLLSWIKKLFV